MVSETGQRCGGGGGGGGGVDGDHNQTTKNSIAALSMASSISEKEKELNLCYYDNNNNDKRRFNTSFHSYRYLVVVFGGLSVGIMFFLRYNVTISVLKMVNQTHLYFEEHPNATMDDMLDDGYIPGGEFNWNNEIQQMIMSYYMLAYTLPQMPMTKLASLAGSRWAIFLSTVVCAVSTLLTPMFAYWGWEYVILLRLLNGLGASAILPMLLSLLEGWLTYDEMTFGLSVSQTISTFCNAINPIIASYLCDIHWKLSFYAMGLGAIVFAILWFILVSDTAEMSMLISQKELDYLRECKLNQFATSKQSIEDKKKNSTPTGKSIQDDEDIYKPNSWMSMFQIPSFYAFLTLWSCHNMAFNGFSFILPTYLSQFLRIKVAESGLYCSIIWSGAILAVMWPHPLLRLLQGPRLGMSAIAARRVAVTLCCSVMVITWSMVGYYHDNQLILLFLNRCTQNSVDMLVTSSLMMNYARAGLSSLAYSAMNTVGNLVVVVSSTFIGWLMDYTGRSATGWSLIFYFFASIQIILWLLFISLIRAEPVKFRKSTSKASKTTITTICKA